MAWGTAANFVESYMRRERPARLSRRWKPSSRAAPPQESAVSPPPKTVSARRLIKAVTALWLPRMKAASRTPEKRTQPMVHLTQTASKQRSERRIAVRLPLRVRGRDSRGVVFEEETSSENLCRSGAAFVTRFDVAIGSDLEIRIPFSRYASRRTEADFLTSGRVVHVVDAPTQGEHVVGVQFTGPRFQRVFRPENAA